MDGIVTTHVHDAVTAPDESVYATLTQRFFAHLLDLVLFAVFFLFLGAFIGVVIGLFPETETVMGRVSGVVFASVSSVLCFMLYRFLAHLWFGQTIGKRILGIEVVQEPGWIFRGGQCRGGGSNHQVQPVPDDLK